MTQAKKLREAAMQYKQRANSIIPGQQIQVDLKDAIPTACKCGCKYFIQAVLVYRISALLSPTGQGLIVQQPVLVCKECGVAERFDL